ncbi:unnamed protein product, partial [Ceratitis capitata]
MALQRVVLSVRRALLVMCQFQLTVVAGSDLTPRCCCVWYWCLVLLHGAGSGVGVISNARRQTS